MALRADRVIQLVRHYLPELWDVSPGMSARKFGLLFAKPAPPGSPPRSNPDIISGTDYSRIIRGAPSKPVLAALAGAEFQQAFTGYFRLPPGIFDSTDEPDFLRRIGKSSKLPATDASDDSLIIAQPLCAHHIALHEVETSVVTVMARSLMTEPVHFKAVAWSASESVGSSFLAYAVAGTCLAEQGIGQCYLIRPYPRLADAYIQNAREFDSREAYNCGLNRLAEHLGIRTGTFDMPRLILEKLESTRSILMALNADLLPLDGGRINRMHDLLDALKQRNLRAKTSPVPVVLVGNIPDVLAKRFKIRRSINLVDQFRTLADRRNQDVRTRNAIRVAFFREQWKRFCQLRGHLPSDDLGPRLNTAKWFYESINDHYVWPASIRMRAFCSSNYDTFSYSDPTAGWMRLAGMPVDAMEIDIRLILDEIVVRAMQVPGGGRPVDLSAAQELLEAEKDRAPEDRIVRQPELRALRWTSLALYWLTEEDVGALVRLFRNRSVHKFHDDVSPNSSHVRVRTEPGQQPTYRASLPFKAVIQSRWIRQDPLGRSRAHYALAHRFWQGQHDKALLQVEFPHQAHYGRARLHLLAECLRHLMRACEGIPRQNAGHEMMSAAFPACDFPAIPKSPKKPVNVPEVVNFCFGEIFWKRINTNQVEGSVHTRKLARRHGLYNLAAELLQLMSEDGRLGQPHWALHPDHIPRYLREVAFSQLDIGNLEGAREHFQRLIEMPPADNQEADRTLMTRIGYDLDMVVTLATTDRLDEAEDVLAGANERMAAFEDLYHARIKDYDAARASAQERHDHAERERVVQKLRNRLKARRAHLLYLQGHFLPALRIYTEMEQANPRFITREVAHPYIAVLGKLGGRDHSDRAMRLIISGRHSSYGLGFHHERMGFEIAEAHLWRKRDEVLVAEQHLDMVSGDILKWGCSERTYIAFLLEAGRVVQAQGRYARAYCSYLRPCHDRAKAMGYVRSAETARRHAVACLEKLPAEIDACGHSGSWTARLTHLIVGRGEFRVVQDEGMEEPKYSFAPFDPVQWLPRLSTAEGIDKEISDLNSSQPRGAEEAEAAD